MASGVSLASYAMATGPTLLWEFSLVLPAISLAALPGVAGTAAGVAGAAALGSGAYFLSEVLEPSSSRPGRPVLNSSPPQVPNLPTQQLASSGLTPVNGNPHLQQIPRSHYGGIGLASWEHSGFDSDLESKYPWAYADIPDHQQRPRPFPTMDQQAQAYLSQRTTINLSRSSNSPFTDNRIFMSRDLGMEAYIETERLRAAMPYDNGYRGASVDGW
ncbi:hypothetical protein [Planctomicrobium sp. SH664]|uniref:hypothetical protein n=1 Tax=Planctomicrobium sp. SH664 TaxID=3448125 RepID=UPI003F5B9F35